MQINLYFFVFLIYPKIYLLYTVNFAIISNPFTPWLKYTGNIFIKPTFLDTFENCFVNIIGILIIYLKYEFVNDSRATDIFL